MPMVTIDLIEGVFGDDEKAAMLDRVTEAMVEVEGEGARGVTWVRINEFKQNDWAIGGQKLDAATVNKLTQRQNPKAA
ncbi:MAG: tautomerase family protein [Erythrobacter sp.]